MWRRLFPWGTVGTRRRPQPAACGRDRDATRRRQQPRVEALEDRQLLAAVTDFPLSSTVSATASLTAGPDGNLWFPVAGEIERITPAGVLTDFPLPGNYSNPSALTVAPDGNLWFSDISLGKDAAVGRITTDGLITEFQGLPGYTSASALTVGPDKNLYFTGSNPSSSGSSSASVGQITLAGQITAFPLASTNNVVSGLTVGPDGNLWFSASSSTSTSASSSIGRITPSGAIREFGLPTGYSMAAALTTSNPFAPPLPGVYPSTAALTTGPDGNLWFPNQNNAPTSTEGTAAIGRITPTGTITEYPLTSGVSSTSTLTVGPDGNLWFSEKGSFSFGSAEQIGQITPAGTITGFPLAPGSSGSTFPTSVSLSGLTVGPDKNLYFTLIVPPNFDWRNGNSIPGDIEIGQISTSGNVLEFAGASDTSLSSINTSAYAPTVGSDGNLWFPAATNIGRLERALATPDQALPPGVDLFPNIVHSKKGGTSIVLQFEQPMEPASAGTAALYRLAAGVKKHHMLVYSKAVRVSRATYDPTAGTVTLKLTNPPGANRLQVTLRAGIMGANGTSTNGNTIVYAG